MPVYTIRNYLGIAPREESASLSAATYATVANDVDLSSGICKPAKSDLVVETGHSGPYFTIFQGALLSGMDCPVNLFAGKKEALVFRQNSIWKKRIGSTTVSLGVPNPSKTSLTDVSLKAPSGIYSEIQKNHPEGVYLERGEYVYHVTYSRESGGKIVEGKAGDPIAMAPYIADDMPNIYHVLYRPTNVPLNATHWNVYRSFNGRPARLLASCSVHGAGDGFDHLIDNYADGFLTRYLGEIGNENVEKYDLSYVITYERVTEGQIDESGPSYPARISVNNIGVRINRPAGIPTGMASWNIYRISEGYNPTRDYQLVARVPVTDSAYEDYFLNDDLGDVIPTSYVSNAGLTVQAFPPPEQFYGMAGPHNGMLIGWIGGSIYYSESGKIDYWNTLYRMEAKGEVVACVPNGSGIVVITTLGVQLITGNQPLAMMIADSLSGYGGLTKRTVASGIGGIFFLSKSGIISVGAGGSTTNLTRKTLGDDYFKNYDYESATMEIVNERIYLSNAAGTLIYDFTNGNITTGTGIYLDLHMDRKGGRLLGLREDGHIVHVSGGNTPMQMEYQTGDLVLGNPVDKRYEQFEFFGEGSLAVKITMEGELVADRIIEMDSMKRFRRIKVPRKYQGRSARIQMVGTGTVREIQVEVQIAPVQIQRR
jgi:hypothetical protein